MNRDLNAIADTIRHSVSALQAGEALGLEPDRHGRCACPVHHGVDRNCKLFDGNKGFVCYVCHSGGDVIRLVQAANGYTFWEAVRWLNETFALDLPLDTKLDEKALEKARMERERRERERQERHEDDMLIFETYVDVQKVIGELEDDVRRYEPEPWDEHWDGRFCDALKRLPEMRETAEELLDLMERRKREEKQRQARE